MVTCTAGPSVHTVSHSRGVNADSSLTEVNPTLRENCCPTSHFPGKTRESPGQGLGGLRGWSQARPESALYSELGQAHSQGWQPAVETRSTAAGALRPGVVSARARMRLMGAPPPRPPLPGLAGGFPTGKAFTEKGPLGVIESHSLGSNPACLPHLAVSSQAYPFSSGRLNAPSSKMGVILA